MSLALAGKRILVVEDEYFIASDLKRLLRREEAEVVGPVAALDAGFALADNEPIDAAILDVNLEGAFSYPIADRLTERSVPYLFLTGYDDWALPAALSGDTVRDEALSGSDRSDDGGKALHEGAGRVNGSHTALQLLMPAIHRLSALAVLDDTAKSALLQAVRRSRTVQPRRELLTEGQEINETLLILNGWAARVRQLADGRRQILGLLLPGDLIGLCDHERPLANASVIAVTAIDVCAAPSRGLSPTLDQAYARSRAMEESHLPAQIIRLGRLNAYERMADLLLELLERLHLAGLATAGGYSLPLTQEMLADMLGLTSVHINRTLQGMRRTGEIIWKGRDVAIVDPPLLYRQIGRVPTRISAAHANRQTAAQTSLPLT